MNDHTHTKSADTFDLVGLALDGMDEQTIRDLARKKLEQELKDLVRRKAWMHDENVILNEVAHKLQTRLREREAQTFQMVLNDFGIDARSKQFSASSNLGTLAGVKEHIIDIMHRYGPEARSRR